MVWFTSDKHSWKLDDLDTSISDTIIYSPSDVLYFDDSFFKKLLANGTVSASIDTACVPLPIVLDKSDSPFLTARQLV